MSSQSAYKDEVNRATLRQKNVESNRLKTNEANKLKSQLAGYKDKATDLYNQVNKLNGDIKATEKGIAAAITAGAPGSVITDLRVSKESLVKQRDAKLAQYNNAIKTVKDFEKKSNKILGKKTLTNTQQNLANPSGNTVNKNGGKAKFPYKYNAPMVRSAYFNPTSISAKAIDENNLTINYAAYDDANQAWKNTKPAKGAIQMDREFTKAQIEGFDTTNKNLKLDLQMYGFKFLYNPKEVSMGWSTQGFIDPSYVPQDEAIPISTQLTASSITFSLVINRIHDMSYLDKSGFMSKQKKASTGTSNNTNPQQRDRDYAANLVSQSPYPDPISTPDLQEIYNKGTMYDIEYLFKTINGPSAVFKNKFGINTADRSYMKLSIVELHLGNSMRYRGRISDLEVNHTIFNNRMVPLFSTVRVSFARINDAFVTPDDGAKK